MDASWLFFWRKKPEPPPPPPPKCSRCHQPLGASFNTYGDGTKFCLSCSLKRKRHV